ncbi:hypothetical protein [Desulfococcus sp.]|uniref:hypothetical protein n=1 Tax=Desulfococcus sp. TaxID=2025834 RepID=UPI0035942D73
MGAASAFVWGCADRRVSQKSIELAPDLQKILVVTFRDMNTDTGAQVNIRCPLSGKVFAAGPVDPAASTQLTNRLMAALKAKPPRDYRLINASDLWEIQARMLDRRQAVTERSLMMETGRALEADAVLVGHLYRYIERVGGNLSVESPASVAFDLHLVRVSDGSLLWTGYFDETQKTLMEDMFDISAFFEREGKWVTAEQMASAGLARIMEGFKIP